MVRPRSSGQSFYPLLISALVALAIACCISVWLWYDHRNTQIEEQMEQTMIRDD